MSWLVNSLVLISAFWYAGMQLHQLWKQAASAYMKWYLVGLTVLHYTMAMLFYVGINKTNADIDAVRYYQSAMEATNWLSLAAVGHGVMAFLIYPFTVFKVSLVVLFIVFATLSLKGFYCYLELVGITQVNRLKKVLLLLFLLPSAHYWTGALGKDALTFLLLALVLLKVKQHAYNWKLGMVLVLLFLIRPHVFLVVVLGLSSVYVLDTTIATAKKRQFMSVVAVFTGLAVLLGLWYFVRVDSLSFAGWQHSLEQFLAYTEDKGATAISLSKTNIATRIGYMLFMPLPWVYPITNLFIVASMIENTVLVGSTVLLAIYFFKNPYSWRKITNDSRFALITSGLLIVLFGSYVYNLGLANRMRMVFLPYVFYVCIMLISTASNETKNN